MTNFDNPAFPSAEAEDAAYEEYAAQRQAEIADEQAARAQGIPTYLSFLEAAERRAEWSADTELCGREPEAGLWHRSP